MVRRRLANRKDYISLYSVAVDDRGYLAEQRAEQEFAGSKSGRSCINIRKPELIDDDAVTRLVRDSAAWAKARAETQSRA